VEHLLAALGLMAALPGFAQGLEVRFPRPGIELVRRLYVPEAKARAPAIVLLHGCSGMWGRDGEPTRTYDACAEHFRRLGFGPRHPREICTQTERPISPARDRPRDAYAALAWLAARADGLCRRAPRLRRRRGRVRGRPNVSNSNSPTGRPQPGSARKSLEAGDRVRGSPPRVPRGTPVGPEARFQ
jgi:hypothetical protein